MENTKKSKIESLKKLKEEVIKELDKNIEEQELCEYADNFNNLSFGNLKNIFECISDKMYETKQIAQYVKALNENKDAKLLYNLYERVVNPKQMDDASLFVNALVNISECIDVKNLKKGKEKIASILKEAVIATKVGKDELEKALEEKNELNDCIEYIFTNKKNLNNIFEFANKLSKVIKYVDENMITDEESEEQDGNLVSNLNNELEGLDPWEGDVVSAIIICDLSGGDKEDLFDKFKDECIKILDDKIEDSENIDDKARLYSIKEQLQNKKFKEEEVNESLLKLAELKKTLMD